MYLKKLQTSGCFIYWFFPGLLFLKFLPIYHMIFMPHFPTCFPHSREETRVSGENQPAGNKFVPLSQRVLSCAAHPLSHTIIAGTQVGFLLWSHTWFPQAGMKIHICWMMSCLNFLYGIGGFLFVLLSIRYRSVWIPSTWLLEWGSKTLTNCLPLQFSSLLMLSQKYKSIRNPEPWWHAVSSTQHLQSCICRITMVFVHLHRALKNYVQHVNLALLVHWTLTRFEVLPAITVFQELMNTQPFTKMHP
jgi:hypothetical protein